MAEKKHDDSKKPNLKCLVPFRLKGRHVVAGEVVAKADFPDKTVWQNLVHMTKPRLEETSDPVGAPKAAKAAKATKAAKGDVSGASEDEVGLAGM